MNVADVRRMIPTVQNMIYVNTGWSGPSPEPVLEQIRSWLDYEVREGPASRPVYTQQEAKRQEARGVVATFLRAAQDEILLTQNTTEGINIVLNGLEWYPGDEVLTLNTEHPSIMVPCLFLQKRKQVRLNVVHLDPADGKEAILRKIEQAVTPRTRLVAVSHISYCTGLRLPLDEMCRVIRSRSAGALVLVDAAQAAGHIEIDVKALGCDFYSLPGHKWLMGPDGIGALYVRQKLISQLQPTNIGPSAATSWSPDGALEPNHDSLEKFDLSTSSTPILAGFQAAMELQEQFGRKEIEDRSMLLAERLREKLARIPRVSVVNPAEPELRCGLVSFAIEAVEPKDLTRDLATHYRIIGRAVNWPESVRLSIHFFNTEEEIDRIAEAVAELATR